MITEISNSRILKPQIPEYLKDIYELGNKSYYCVNNFKIFKSHWTNQTEVTQQIREIALSFNIEGKQLIYEIKRYFLENIAQVEASNFATKVFYKWSRSAQDIYDHGFVIKGDSCTDFAILIIAALRSLGIESSFVKLYKSSSYTHSHVRILLNGRYYFLSPENVKKRLETETRFKNQYLKKWKIFSICADSWSMGLFNVFDCNKIID